MVGTTITHIIFDFDGVLIDTEGLYSEAISRCLKPYDKKFTIEMKTAQMGRKKEEAVRVLLEINQLLDHVDVEAFTKIYDDHLLELLPTCPELPGASKLIDHFHSKNIPLAICTGSNHTEFHQKTQKFKHWLEKIKPQVLSGSDPEVLFGKPHPDPYLVTLRRFEKLPVSPKNVLVFEDSINGVRSALAAGLNVIMVPQDEFLPSNWAEIRAELEPQLAEILTSLEEFEPLKYGLPDFDE